MNQFGKVQYISKRYLQFGDKTVAPGEPIPDDHGFTPLALERWVKEGRLVEFYPAVHTVTREQLLDRYVEAKVKKKQRKKQG